MGFDSAGAGGTEQVDIFYAAAPDASAPLYQSAEAAGADVSAKLDAPLVIEPGKRALVPTGISLEIPCGYEVQLRPRSGLALKYGITVLNAPGTIDSDYRGEIKVLLANFGEEPFTVHDGDRIGQLVVHQVFRGVFKKKQALSETKRGEGGYGSTGI